MVYAAKAHPQLADFPPDNIRIGPRQRGTFPLQELQPFGDFSTNFGRELL